VILKFHVLYYLHTYITLEIPKLFYMCQILYLLQSAIKFIIIIIYHSRFIPKDQNDLTMQTADVTGGKPIAI
jgi:hypothetical protein